MSLAQIVSTVAETYAPVAEDSGQRLNAVVDPTPTIYGDRELLTQMGANLIENSIRHCPAGVGITVSVVQEAGAPGVRGADTGPGIPAAERDKVFRRFYRLGARRTTQGHGRAGALVKAVADLHDASAELSDNFPGLRCTVRFHAAGDGGARTNYARGAPDTQAPHATA